MTIIESTSMTDGIHHKTCHEKFVDLRFDFLESVKKKWDIEGGETFMGIKWQGGIDITIERK